MASALAVETASVDTTALAKLDARTVDCPEHFVYVESTDSQSCMLVRDNSDSGDIDTLEQRQERRATIFYDNRNRIRLIFTWVINQGLADIFKNSGYNLGKAIMSEAKRYLISTYGDADVRYYARLARWVGSIDQVSRTLHNANGLIRYSTVAINIELNNNPSYNINFIRAVAAGLATWVNQGQGNAEIRPVNNAFEAGSARKMRREDQSPNPLDTVLKARQSTDWCNAPYGGLFNNGGNNTPRKLYYDFEC
jgi:hypothetical protein